ncbi:Glycosyltransferase involved in cell wall bisynthesis [Paenibacillus tianmuensis]|uniref:Glycosyltransferase involved in cell wall bisynthesis n=2 Tax=Paenibacillus tianmuensis TaxID=624147 RepID=A0A1G4R5J4_9BACL|nr:Glycosyltransferase involved in cell wall bisynthesis [Paenibacillus tianmuensis]
MNIVIMNSLYSPDIIGGAEISTQILAETLSGAGLRVSVVTVGAQNRSIGVVTDTVGGIEIIRVPHNNLYWLGESKGKSGVSKVIRRLIDIYNPLQLKEIRRILIHLKPDLIHTQNLSGLGAGVWKVAADLGIPVVHTLRDYSLLSPMSTTDIHPFIKGLYKQVPLRFSSCVSAVVGISSHILNKHTEAGLFAHSIKAVVPNAVDGAVRSIPKPAVSGALKLGCFGRVEAEKGIAHLVEAVKQLPPQIVERLYICGEGSLKEQLVKRCADDPRIAFTGKVTPAQARELMSEVDLTIVPSTWDEPFGRVIIESYQAGTPVYASAVGGIPDIVTDRSECLFEPGSTEAIKRSILSYYHQSPASKQRMLDRCLEHCSNFTSDALAEKHLDLYKQVCGSMLSRPKAVNE